MASTAYIEVRSPAGHQKVPVGEQPVSIGRHSSNAIVLVDEMASRHHCIIERVPEGFRVKDLDSRNGIKINGESAKEALLLPTDVVTIGKSILRVVLPEGAAAPPRAKAEPRRAAPESKPVPAGVEEDAELVLTQLADSLPDKDFEAGDIALVNARGIIAHAAKSETPAKKESSEALTLIRLLLLVCFRIRATDIHIEQKNDDCTMRLRVDGNMVDVARLSKDVGLRMTSLIKILCDIDIAQRNIVQEGHFSARASGRRVDYRVSFAPAMFGQKLVVRILDTSNTPLHIKDLSLPADMYSQIVEAVEQEAGMVLVCGPTGSGKTTTLYAIVRDIDINQRNVVTIEDPVEIQLEGVTQIPVNDAQGNTFSSLLRSVLRQDPDAILVGEIRDPETARIAMQAAITGHLVFSTVHSRDTVGTVFRLLDLGVEPYLVAQGLHLVLAQRLVRQLCPFCKKPVTPTAQQLQKMGEVATGVKKIYEPVGCLRCLNTGFAGRRAICELLITTPALRETILKSPTIGEINIALGPSFKRLSTTGYALVVEGISPFDEVDRAVS